MLTPPTPPEYPGPVCKSALRLLQEEYPGITRMWPIMQWVLREDQKLCTLAEFIRYNIPKAYYSHEVYEFDQLIQDAYLEHQHCNEQQSASFEDQLQQLEAQIGQLIRRVSPTSDEDEANCAIAEQRGCDRRPISYSIQEVRNFVNFFSSLNDQTKVSLELVHQIETISACKKEKADLDVNSLSKYEKYSVPRINKYNQKEQHSARKVNSGHPRPKEEREPIVITLGDKIPLQTKELRNYIKKMSQSSFSVLSQQMELGKNEIEKCRTNIDLALNIVTCENMIEIFQDNRALVMGNEELGHYLVDQVLAKCIDHSKFAILYIQFLMLFTKIPTSAFKWQWGDFHLHSRTGINAVHRVLVDKIDSIFRVEVANKQKHKTLKHVCFIIGALIEKRKLSRRVFTSVINKVLQQLFASAKEQDKEAQESYFEAIIRFIEGLKQFYDSTFAFVNISDMLSPQNCQDMKRAIGSVPATIQEMLIKLSTSFDFETTRIQCLIKNLFERKQSSKLPSQQQGELNKNREVSEHKIREIFGSKEGITAIIDLYEHSGKSAAALTKILLALFDNTKPKMEQGVEQLLTHLMPVCLPASELISYWQSNFMSFVLCECDMPEMIHGLTLIFSDAILHQSSTAQVSNFIVETGPDCEQADREDVLHFMNKLEAALHRHLRF